MGMVNRSNDWDEKVYGDHHFDNIPSRTAEEIAELLAKNT